MGSSSSSDEDAEINSAGSSSSSTVAADLDLVVGLERTVLAFDGPSPDELSEPDDGFVVPDAEVFMGILLAWDLHRVSVWKIGREDRTRCRLGFLVSEA